MTSTCKHGVEDARKNLPVLLERANRGQTVIITKRGKPFAAIVPIDQAPKQDQGLSLSALRGTGKGMWGKGAAVWVERLRKEW
jgi:prevent-host-death family protein